MTGTPSRVHPSQRYSMGTLQGHATTYEFIGSVEVFDVFWLSAHQIIMVKFANETGKNFELRADGWTANYGAVGVKPPTPEQTEVIIAMCQCFARDNRPEEWAGAEV